MNGGMTPEGAAMERNRKTADELVSVTRHAMRMEDVMVRAHGALRAVQDEFPNSTIVTEILGEMEAASPRCRGCAERNPK